MTPGEVEILLRNGGLVLRSGRPAIPESIPLSTRVRLHRAVGIALRVFRRKQTVRSLAFELKSTTQYVRQELNLGMAYLLEMGWLRREKSR